MIMVTHAEPLTGSGAGYVLDERSTIRKVILENGLPVLEYVAGVRAQIRECF